MDTQQSAQDTKIDKNVSDVAKNTADITKYTADVAKNTSDIAENKKDIAQNTEDIAAMPPYVDAYTKTETNTLLDAKADKGESYTKAEIDASQAAQDEAIAALSDQEAITYKGSINATNTGAPVDANVGDMYINDFNPAEPNTVYPVAEYGDWGMVTEVKYNDKLIKVAGGWDKIEAPQIPDVVGPDSPFKFYGTTAVSTPAPYDPVEGQMMFNKVEGYPDPSWGIDTDLLIPVDAVLIYELMTPGKWGVIQAPSNADDVIKEAPKDGKQYARQDETWTEVEASGGGEAQPPVAFETRLSANTPVSSDATWLKCELDDVVTDTDSAIKDGGYTIPKDGIYNISFMHGVSAEKNLNKHYAQLYVNGKTADTSVAISHTEIVNGGNHGLSGTTVREFKAGDVVELWYYVKVTSTALGTQTATVCRLSGHMISSITEGEVKEKEAVTMKASVSTTQNVTKGDWTKVKFDTTEWDTDSSFDTDTNEYIPKVEGYYQINAGGSCADGTTTRQGVSIYLNGVPNTTSYNLSTSGTNTNVQVSNIVYCNGVDDKIHIAIIHASGTNLPIKTGSNTTYFTASLITGQSSGGGSASGDSIWTEVDGKAVYDGDIKVNGLTVGKGGGNVLTNTAFGVNALANAEDTNQNTAVGFSALSNITLGGSNTAIGVDAGKLLTVGDNNIIIGNDAQPSESVVNNEVTIGNREIKKTRLMGIVQLFGKGIEYTGAGGSNTIGFKWRASGGERLIATIDNVKDFPIASTTRLAEVEEAFDKKLAIKDKLIEKLSKRLDKLEARMKK